MATALGVSPVIVFLGLMIGFRLNGPGGNYGCPSDNRTGRPFFRV